MLRKIESYIRKYHMIEAGDHVIAGVSGGADSICLLLVLLQLREMFGYTVSAVHVEHGIRGKESLADAAFVRRFCEGQGVACRVFHCCVPEYAKTHGMGEEEAGRVLRYSFFGQEKERFRERNVKIAVAHNLNDHAETMLFQLARGAGISGLGGIAPVRGAVIRPLLSISRDEIEEYLMEAGQGFCEDATNAADQYSRNRIRHAVLPVLTQVNNRAKEHMYEAAAELREIDAYLAKQAKKELAKCCSYQGEEAWIEKGAFEMEDPVLQREMLHRLVTKLAGSSRDITREHICQLLALFDRQTGRRIDLPYGLTAARTYEGVRFFRKRIEIEAEKESKLPDDSKNMVSYRVITDITNFMPQISKKKYTKWFDYDKIKVGFCVRNRMPGDYLVINDSGDRQKLKKYLVNEKIPEKEREQLLLLADGSHIMWVIGHRISSYYKVNAHTRKILEVTFYGGKENE